MLLVKALAARASAIRTVTGVTAGGFTGIPVSQLLAMAAEIVQTCIPPLICLVLCRFMSHRKH